MTTQEMVYIEVKKEMISIMSTRPQFGAIDCEVDAKIEKQVYELYGLTEEEIRIVEGK